LLVPVTLSSHLPAGSRATLFVPIKHQGAGITAGYRKSRSWVILHGGVLSKYKFAEPRDSCLALDCNKVKNGGMVMQHQSPDTAAIALRMQLEQERHERRLDWVSVAILGLLTLLSLWMLWQMMASSAGPSPHVAEAGTWAKTFLTLLGGVAIGVLARDRLRRGRQAHTPIAGREQATAELSSNSSLQSTTSGRG
jgi:hypothetical protein